MTKHDNPDGSDEIRLGDFFAPLLNYRHLIWHGTIAATALTILIGGIHYFRQPVRWSTSLEFRPIFKGADIGEYPNELKFASTDVVDPTVIDQVHTKNNIGEICSASDFRSGFVVEESSSGMRMLDLDYQARLSDTRLSNVERERLQGEYRARRQTMEVQYRLTWLRAAGCRELPAPVATKAVEEVLQTWANDSELKRGALKLRVAVLRPTVFDERSVGDTSFFVRADLVRAALLRVINNIGDVLRLPGAELIYVGTDDVSFAQVQARLQDLVEVHLDPLAALAGRGSGGEETRFVEQSLAQAIDRSTAADSRANAYQSALREYSGATVSASQAGAARQQNPTDVQALTPQIDSTFIDRIVELTAANTTFRQGLTRQMVDAKVTAIDSAARVAHYQQLLTAIKSNSRSLVTDAEISRRLAAVVATAKEQTQQFNALYDEFSRVALRPGPSMYRVERPPQVDALRSFAFRSLWLLVLAVAFGTPFALAIGCLAHHALHHILRRPVRT